MKLRCLFAAALALCAGAVHAQSLPVVDGVTSVQLTSAPTLVGLGFGVAPLGTATVSPGSDGVPIAYFPVTGGSFNTATFAGGIAHDGSGLSLTRGGTTVELENFFINTVTLRLLGDVSIGSGPPALNDTELFSIAPNPAGPFSSLFFPFQLTLTSGASTALEGAFGLPSGSLTGAVIGLANTIPITTAVPEPSTYAMLLAGLGVIGWMVRRRTA
jgi:hypothetical protein